MKYKAQPSVLKYLKKQFNLLREINPQDDSPEEAIHNYRLVLKRLRALLELTPVNSKNQKMKNQLRVFAKKHSQTRDQHVLLQNLNRYKIPIANNQPKDVKRLSLAEIKKLLALENSFIRLFKVLHLSKSDLKHTKKKLKKSVKKALKSRTEKSVHQMRKNAKDLQYQTEAVTNHSPNKVKIFAESIGEWRDLRLLQKYLEKKSLALKKAQEEKIFSDLETLEKLNHKRGNQLL